MRRLLCVLLVASCRSATDGVVIEDAHVPLDAPNRVGAGPGGGLLDDLRFAIVGDTRPANLDDTSGYPTAIIQQIWGEIDAENPKTSFAVTTGDYMFASTSGAEVDPQLDLYLGARTAYSGVVYPVLGNHECTGFTASNCGPGSSDGMPPNYTQFMVRMLGPIAETRPYFIERFAARDGSWSAKVVFIAANAWNIEQSRWLELVLTEPTTYTFVVRHEPHDTTSAPGVAPSQRILSKHPMTLMIVGHAHTYRRNPSAREIIVGNGGAPASAGTNYGYVIVARQPDDTIQITSYEYTQHLILEQFTVMADGNPA